MTKQGWTATVSTALFVVLIALVSLIPVPFVSWTPGKATNVLGAEDGEPVLQISGATTYPTEGELQLATVAVTRRESDMSLPQAFIAYLLPAQTVLPREVVYPIGRPATQQQANAVQQMVTSQREAVVAALVEAGIPVTPLPLVTQVSSSGPAYGKVEVGDLVTSVDGSVVSRRADVQAVLAQVVPGRWCGSGWCAPTGSSRYRSPPSRRRTTVGRQAGHRAGEQLPALGPGRVRVDPRWSGHRVGWHSGWRFTKRSPRLADRRTQRRRDRSGVRVR